MYRVKVAAVFGNALKHVVGDVIALTKLQIINVLAALSNLGVAVDSEVIVIKRYLGYVGFGLMENSFEVFVSGPAKIQTHSAFPFLTCDFLHFYSNL